ncbi:type II secretion system F family protein [Nocardioides sp.]|uniref:type II secretion system F family protein n=1 Tax=Nocardioides sp. TaxID=35761 RepID=UPI00262C88EA|nr:type II secretion system F family protein [Nocardioides sp.]MDI6910564.1 type II secretion system F family protein [Nocardioides sp.]
MTALLSVLPALAAAAAAALLLPHRPTLSVARTRPEAAPSAGWLHGHRWLWSGLAAIGALALVGGRAGPPAAVVAAVATWTIIGRAETPDARRRREAVRQDLPHVVDLFAATLRGGAAPAEGIALVCAALPGPAADRLSGITARLALGLDPGQVWSALADDPHLGRLGRTLARAHTSGAPVVAAVERLADDLARSARADTEERARAVGVKAALPLGLCLLPAFVLIGIVPLVVALLATLEL